MAAATGMAAAAKTRTQQRYTSHTTGVAPACLCVADRACVGIQSTRTRRKGGSDGQSRCVSIHKVHSVSQSVISRSRPALTPPPARSPARYIDCCCCETHNAHALRAPKHEGRYRNIDFFVRTKTAPHYRYSPLLSKLATNLLFQPAQLQETSLILRHTGHRTCAR